MTLVEALDTTIPMSLDAEASKIREYIATHLSFDATSRSRTSRSPFERSGSRRRSAGGPRT
jgi:hypothetical protein